MGLIPSLPINAHAKLTTLKGKRAHMEIIKNYANLYPIWTKTINIYCFGTKLMNLKENEDNIAILTQKNGFI